MNSNEEESNQNEINVSVLIETLLLNMVKLEQQNNLNLLENELHREQKLLELLKIEREKITQKLKLKENERQKDRRKV